MAGKSLDQLDLDSFRLQFLAGSDFSVLSSLAARLCTVLLAGETARKVCLQKGERGKRQARISKKIDVFADRKN